MINNPLSENKEDEVLTIVKLSSGNIELRTKLSPQNVVWIFEQIKNQLLTGMQKQEKVIKPESSGIMKFVRNLGR